MRTNVRINHALLLREKMRAAEENRTLTFPAEDKLTPAFNRTGRCKLCRPGSHIRIAMKIKL